MAAKTVTLKDCDAARLKMLRDQIGKVRCWLAGYHAGRHVPAGLPQSIPGEDALRQLQEIIDNSL
jgi:hypothetical protein